MKNRKLGCFVLLAIIATGIATPCGCHRRNPETDPRFASDTVKFQFSKTRTGHDTVSDNNIQQVYD